MSYQRSWRHRARFTRQYCLSIRRSRSLPTVWNTVDFDLDATASVINLVVDLSSMKRRIRTCSDRGIRS
ncbi:hypothetical protein BGY98DRAFT_1042678 [Russula aff. rugulosa BPL654]|nr:hypothetical protein BGY98DRAFT_1042678 [Russula aff. rugulosa BPL654]